MRRLARWALAAVIAYLGGVALAYVLVAWARHTDYLADLGGDD